MKTETNSLILLSDYTPPAFLIDTVRLDVVLHPTATRVTAKLKLRPNPAGKGKRGKALVLDGEQIALVSLHLARVTMS
jgi:aminopeptidase N